MDLQSFVSKDDLFKRRYFAVRNAMNNAKNPEFKQLWKDIMSKIVHNETERTEGDYWS
jgi:hypothetical protein